MGYLCWQAIALAINAFACGGAIAAGIGFLHEYRRRGLARWCAALAAWGFCGAAWAFWNLLTY